MLEEFKAYLEKELNQKKPSKEFLEKISKSLFGVLSISFMAGQYWVKLKTEIDNGTVEKIKGVENFAKLSPDAAIEFLGSKLDKKVAAYLKKIEKATAAKIDTMTKLSFYDNAKHLTEFISSSLEKGESIQKAIKRLGEKELLDKIGITDENKYYLETVVRTNQITAMSAGDRIESLANSDVEYYQYIAILDPRTTDVCKSLEAKILKKDNELWNTHLPPNHFNCRSRVITFSKGLAEQLDLKESSKVGIEKPDDNFAVDPSKIWSMPTKDMRQRLADHLGVDYKDIPKGAKFEN
jgi:SPP1 gp7 family putative phage head morphogenesis protein